MTDAPIPPASAPPPTGPPTPTAGLRKRPWTFLGRIAQALREQNWAAVAVEIVIVVLGVVIGFQVTAWGQARADRAQEQVYLRQLAADLDESLRVITHADSVHGAVSTPALLTVLGSWGSGTPLPADSIVHHSRRMFTGRSVQPTTGTGEALLATGDLTLIRNDSLRNAVTAYLGATETLVAFQARVAEQYNDAIVRYIPAVGANRVARVDLGTDLFQRSISQSKRLTDDGWVPPFPLDSSAFYASQEAYHALSEIAIYSQVADNVMAAMSQQAGDLRQQIQAELDR